MLARLSLALVTLLPINAAWAACRVYTDSPMSQPPALIGSLDSCGDGCYQIRSSDGKTVPSDPAVDFRSFVEPARPRKSGHYVSPPDATMTGIKVFAAALDDPAVNLGPSYGFNLRLEGNCPTPSRASFVRNDGAASWLDQARPGMERNRAFVAALGKLLVESDGGKFLQLVDRGSIFELGSTGRPGPHLGEAFSGGEELMVTATAFSPLGGGMRSRPVALDRSEATADGVVDSSVGD